MNTVPLNKCPPRFVRKIVELDLLSSTSWVMLSEDNRDLQIADKEQGQMLAAFGYRRVIRKAKDESNL